MSSVAYNLQRKLEWMSRQLKKIDGAEAIQNWVRAMTAINDLVKECAKSTEVFRDDWRSWTSTKTQRHDKTPPKKKERDLVVTKILTPDPQEKRNNKLAGSSWVKKAEVVQKTLPPNYRNMKKQPHKAEDVIKPTASYELSRKCRSTTKGITGIKDDGGKNPGDNERGKKRIKLEPKAAVMEMLRESKDQQERNKMQVDESSPKQKMNIEIWRNDMLKVAARGKKPVEHWGDVQSGNFRRLIGDCTQNWVKESVIEDMGHREAYDYLYNELMKFYD